jgi:hypothetical protein
MLVSNAYALVVNGIYTASEAAVIVVGESAVPTTLRQYTAERVWFKLLSMLG